MFSVVAEALTIALAAVPSILKVELASSNAALSPLLALCVIFSGALGVVLARHNSHCQADTPAPQGRTGLQARPSSVRQDPPAAATAPSLRRRPNGLREDLKWRDSEELLELSLGGTPASRHDPLHATAGAAAAAAAATASAPSRSTKNGHGRHRAEEREDAPKSSSSRNTTNNSRPSAVVVPRSSRSAAPASASSAAPAAPAKRQRHHHHYRKGGEVLFIAEGVAQAAMGLVRDPVRGAQADGAKGLVKGLGSGVLGVVLKPVKGVAKAGVNAYTGVRIGASKAGRVIVGGGGGGSRSGSSKPPQGEEEQRASTETAASKANGRKSHSGAAASRRGGGGLRTGDADQHNAGGLEERRSSKAGRSGYAGSDRTGDVGVGNGQRASVVEETAERLPAERGTDGVAGAATTLGGAGAVTGGDGRNGRRHPAASAGLGLGPSPPPSPFDGLAVAVSTVPLVLSSVFVLAELNRISGGSGGGEVDGAAFAPKGYGEDLEEASGSVCADGADLAAYLEVMLEGSILCAVWEVMFAVQRAARVRGRGRRESSTAVWSRVLSSQLLRLSVLLVGCVRYCRRPLLPLWCVAVYDVVRRALDLHHGRQMRRLSLRPGEAAVLAQAFVLWAADAFVYTAQELCVVEPRAWQGMFPRVPDRSGGMVIVQTGILGTLVTGLAVSVARALAPAAWRSSPPPWQGHALTYAVFASGTAAWLTRWTAPLLRANPVAWVLLYALGYADPAAAAARAARHTLHSLAAAEGTGWGGAGATVAHVFGAVGWARSEFDDFATGRDGVVASGEGMRGSRPLLVAGWAAALAVGVPLVPWLSRRLSLSKTASRKLFHALATAMFLPAIALERDFLSLALGAALGVLLAMELLRCAECPPLAAALDRYFGEFLDARDGGCVVVTHLFLLLGCAVPVWLCGLTGSRNGDGVLPYGGVVVLGIGDAMGAVVGSSMGRLHWPGSRRTLEGSASVFLSTLASLVLVSSALTRRGGESDGMGGGWWLWEGAVGWGELAAALAWPAALVSLMEAFTTQVDNLILPCVLFSCLALTEA